MRDARGASGCLPIDRYPLNFREARSWMLAGARAALAQEQADAGDVAGAGVWLGWAMMYYDQAEEMAAQVRMYETHRGTLR